MSHLTEQQLGFRQTRLRFVCTREAIEAIAAVFNFLLVETSTRYMLELEAELFPAELVLLLLMDA